MCPHIKLITESGYPVINRVKIFMLLIKQQTMNVYVEMAVLLPTFITSTLDPREWPVHTQTTLTAEKEHTVLNGPQCCSGWFEKGFPRRGSNPGPPSPQPVIITTEPYRPGSSGKLYDTGYTLNMWTLERHAVKDWESVAFHRILSSLQLLRQ